MKQNTIKNFLLIGLVGCAASAVLTGCRFEEDDYFDESASLRVEHATEKVQDILVSAPQGWVMQYYAATGSDGFEGFNLFARFEQSGKVTLAGNHRYLRDGNAGKYTEASSVYELLLEDGPVLAFNTWNDVLTPFVDPVDPSSAPNALVKDGAGMAGDHNFVVMSYADDEVILRGERHSAEVRLAACDRSWEDYIADTETMKNAITNTSITSYYVTNDTDTLYFLNPRSGHFRYAERIDDPLRARWISCCYTPDGFRIEHEDTIGPNKFQEFKLAADSTCLVNEDETVKVIACWDKYVVDCSSSWHIAPESFTTEQASLYAQMEEEVKKVNTNYVLDSITISRTTETLANGAKVAYPGLKLYIHGPKRMGRTPIYTPYVNMNIDKPAFGQIQFSQSSVDYKNDYMEMFASTNLKSQCLQFAASLYGTYTIAPNHYFHPTEAMLMPISSGNSIKLKLKEIEE